MRGNRTLNKLGICSKGEKGSDLVRVLPNNEWLAMFELLLSRNGAKTRQHLNIYRAIDFVSLRRILVTLKQSP